MDLVYSNPGLGGLALWADGLLPAAHLLDATWWFDNRTVVSFRDRMVHQPIEGKVVFLGTPSLFLDSFHRGSGIKMWLFDQDDAIRRLLPQELRSHFVSLDLRRTLPLRVGAHLIIADPPWYMAELEAFLAAAQAVACLGASVEVCIPPIGTRPGIEQEREQLFAWAEAGGLLLMEVLQNAIRYDTPPFERNALLSVGKQVQENSRSGDVAKFRVEGLTGLLPRLHPREHKWADVQLLNTRWRVADSADGTGRDPALISMGWPSDIFPSCSRRHSQRDLPSVWTSGNRAFRCNNPQGFLDILRSMPNKSLSEITSGAAERYPEKNSPEAKTAAQIVKVLDIEHKEDEALRKCLSGKE
ncbi:MAG: hypothetical protein JWQ49_4170 [Edaphobacter sp.]|nr:hypothetical protein [Edaphobacter sp.]